MEVHNDGQKQQHVRRSVKSKFTPEEDLQLVHLILSRKELDWNWIASQMPNRNSRQCRERWSNYLDPQLQKGQWTEEEDRIILAKKETFGPKWSVIAGYLKGRSGNDVRNRWLLIMRHSMKARNQVALLHEDKQPRTAHIITPPMVQTQEVVEPPKNKVVFAPILSLVPNLVLCNII